jgi:hypothetical protein
VKNDYIYIIIKNNHIMKDLLTILALFGLSAYSYGFAFYGDIPVDNQIAMFLLGSLTLSGSLIYIGSLIIDKLKGAQK